MKNSTPTRRLRPLFLLAPLCALLLILTGCETVYTPGYGAVGYNGGYYAAAPVYDSYGYGYDPYYYGGGYYGGGYYGGPYLGTSIILNASRNRGYYGRRHHGGRRGVGPRRGGHRYYSGSRVRGGGRRIGAGRVRGGNRGSGNMGPNRSGAIRNAPADSRSFNRAAAARSRGTGRSQGGLRRTDPE